MQSSKTHGMCPLVPHPRLAQATREVAGLLVKQEEVEVAKMKSLATDLTRQYR